MHNFKNRVIIVIITSILATVATKIYYWDTLNIGKLWFVFCLFIVILMTYGLIVSYIIDRLANMFDSQLFKILVRISLYLIAGVLPFIGTEIILLSIITAILYVVADALYPLPKS